MKNFKGDFTMADETTCTTKSCVPCGFCWKNVWHWALALALLPFVVKGVGVVMNAVHNVVDLFSGK
jgi:hypothetical protein